MWVGRGIRAHTSDNGRATGKRLKAAAVAATAPHAILAEHDVSNLAGPKLVAAEQPPVEHNAGAEPLFALDDNQVRRAAGPAKVVLGHHRGVAIVQYVRWHAVTDLEQLAQRQIQPVEIDRPVHLAAALAVDEARCSDPEPKQGRAHLGHELIDQHVHQLQRLLPATTFALHAEAVLDLAPPVHDGTPELLAG